MGYIEGTKKLLGVAFARGKKVTIALTSDVFVKKYKKSTLGMRIASWIDRKRALEAWIDEKSIQTVQELFPSMILSDHQQRPILTHLLSHHKIKIKEKRLTFFARYIINRHLS